MNLTWITKMIFTRYYGAHKTLGWRAFSLRWPYQLFLIAFSILLLVGIEVMRRVSNHYHGLAHFQDPNDIPNSIQVIYNYVPTIFAVIYSIMWSFVDSDAKRLEPYFQMSLNTSPATNLLLDYTFYSVFTVPFRAIKSRHWIIVAISTSYLVISLVLPGSMGALISLDGASLYNQREEFRITGSAHGPHDFYEGDFLIRSRAIIASRGQDMPQWTTLDYAVQPFEANTNDIGRNDTWTANTTVVFAEPRCQRMDISNWAIETRCCMYEGKSPYAHFLYYRADLRLPDGDNSSCQMSLSMLKFDLIEEAVQGYSTHLVVETPYVSSMPQSPALQSFNLTNFDIERQPISLENGNLSVSMLSSTFSSTYERNTDLSCPIPNRMSVLIDISYNSSLSEELRSVWNNKRPDGTKSGSTNANIELEAAQILSEMVSFDPQIYACSTEYFSSPAEVAVRGSDKSVLNIKPSAEKTQLAEYEFNRTNFETVIDSGTITDISNDLNMTYFPTGSETPPTLPKIPRNITHLDPEALGIWAVTSTTGFSLVALEETMKYFNNATLAQSSNYLGQALEKTYRILFATAFSSLMQSQASSGTVNGFRDQYTFALVVTPSFAILSECLLALGALTLLLSLVGYSRRASTLRSDPDSLSAQCSFIADCIVNRHHLKHLTSGLDYQPTSSIQQVFQTAQLVLDDKHNTLEVIDHQEFDGDMSTASTDKELHKQPGKADKIPFFVRRRGALAIVVALLVIPVILLFLRFWTSRVNGISFQQELKTFKSQLMWSFAPALLATCVEACWVSVHRDLSVLEPWVRLKDKASSSQSMALRYSSRPPVLVLMLSLKRKHFLISFVSLLCISTSILNVSMAGLFTQSYLNIPRDRAALLNITGTELLTDWFPILAGTKHYLVWGLLYSNYTDGANLGRWTDQTTGYVPVYGEDYGGEAEDFITFTSTTLGFEASLECEALTDNEELRRSGLDMWSEMVPGSDSTSRGRIRYLPREITANSTNVCEAAFLVQHDLPLTFFQWSKSIERNTSRSQGYAIDSEWSDSELTDNGNREERCFSKLVFSYTDFQSGDVTHYLCQPDIVVDDFDIIYDDEEYIIAATKSASNDSSLIQNISGFRDMYAFNWMLDASGSYAETAMGVFDWPGFLMTKLRHREPDLSVPEAMSRIFKESFAQWFRDKYFLLESSEKNQTQLAAPSASIIRRERRIVPSVPAFGLSIALIIIYLAGYLLILNRRRHRYTGPRMPKAIGSLIPWVVHSQMLGDFKGLHDMSSAKRDQAISRLGTAYGFGRFRGKNGKVRLGIEHEELLLANGGFGDF